MDSKERLLCQIGETIKTARLAQEISAEALAKSVHISRATLWSIEKGFGKASISTYLDLSQVLGLSLSLNGKQKTNVDNKRNPKRITKEKTKKNQFEVFCIEKYAQHINIPSNNVYAVFKEENLLQLLRSDYEDLHGMGTEFLMNFFDSYLEKKQA